jgi:replication factor A1
MLINELKANQGNIVVTGEITEKGDTREFEKFGKKGRVCNATLKDKSGSVKLTLWNDDIDKVNASDMIKIENGWVSEWKGELQLSTGKFGKIEVLGKADPKAAKEPEQIKKTEEATQEHFDEPEEIDEEFIEDIDEENN